VDPHQPLGMLQGQPVGHHGADVAAVGAELLITEDLAHEPRPEFGNPVGAAPTLQGIAEAVAGQRRDHHVEGVCGVAAVAGRVGQQRDQGQQLIEGARPAVGAHQRQRRRPLAPHVTKWSPTPSTVARNCGNRLMAAS
jgi:hypothetical protein